MSTIGTVRNGVVVLPPGANLPEGAEVTVTVTPHETAPRDLEPEDDPFLAAVMAVAKVRPDWAADDSLNHGHYVSGEPKKS